MLPAASLPPTHITDWCRSSLRLRETRTCQAFFDLETMGHGSRNGGLSTLLAWQLHWFWVSFNKINSHRALSAFFSPLFTQQISGAVYYTEEEPRAKVMTFLPVIDHLSLSHWSYGISSKQKKNNNNNKCQLTVYIIILPRKYLRWVNIHPRADWVCFQTGSVVVSVLEWLRVCKNHVSGSMISADPKEYRKVSSEYILFYI